MDNIYINNHSYTVYSYVIIGQCFGAYFFSKCKY